MQTIRWGIAGLGKIAGKFAEGLALVPGAKLVAVASSSGERAQAFAAQHQVPRAYDHFAALAQDPAVDVVYVAAPHSDHHPLSLLMMQHGKAVLCEKPLAMSLTQVSEMIATAEARQVYFMEALWTKFLPQFTRLQQLVQQQAIGQVRSVHAQFAFVPPFLPERRVLNKALGGGALLDIGIYPILLANSLLGPPDQLLAQAQFGPTGVDEQCNMLFHYASGATAVLSCAFAYTGAVEATIYGTEGYLHLHHPWHGLCPALSWYNGQRELVEKIHFAHHGNGYNHEAEAVGHDLRAGRLQNPMVSHEFSRQLMATLDRTRLAAGIHYD
jgi:predicted dehydrogenase